MKLFSVILFVTCVSLALGCEWGWTGCEGLLRDHDTVCKEYSFDEFAGDSSGSGCGWTSLKRKCRRGNRVCQWTGCEGGMIDPQKICDQYGYGERTATGGDCGFTKIKVQCCTKCTEA